MAKKIIKNYHLAHLGVLRALLNRIERKREKKAMVQAIISIGERMNKLVEE